MVKPRGGRASERAGGLGLVGHKNARRRSSSQPHIYHTPRLPPNSGDLLPDVLLAISKRKFTSFRFNQYRKALDPLRTTFHDQASVAMFRSITQILGLRFHRDRLRDVVKKALNTTLKGMQPPDTLVSVTAEAYQLFAGSKPLLYHHNFPFLMQPWPRPSVYVTIVEPPSHYMAKMVYRNEGVSKCMTAALGQQWKYDPEADEATLANQLTPLVGCLPAHSLTRMFCGRAKSCGPLYADATRTDALTDMFAGAVEQAKLVISDHYLFVGTSERMDDSLRILGNLLPAFFMVNFDELYKSPAWVEIQKLISPSPLPLPKALTDAMLPLIRWDVEVYEHAASLVDEYAAGCQGR